MGSSSGIGADVSTPRSTKESPGQLLVENSLRRSTSTRSTRSEKASTPRLAAPDSATLPLGSPSHSPRLDPPTSPHTPRQKRLVKSMKPPRSSLAPEMRSPLTQSYHIERVAKGVRFKLRRSSSDTSLGAPSTETAKSQLSARSPGWTSVRSPVSAVESTARSDFRIPGTGLTLNLPFSVPGTPKFEKRLSGVNETAEENEDGEYVSWDRRRETVRRDSPLLS
jgi:hypothetical protein